MVVSAVTDLSLYIKYKWLQTYLGCRDYFFEFWQDIEDVERNYDIIKELNVFLIMNKTTEYRVNWKIF